MMKERTYPLILRFHTHVFGYQFLWLNQNYLKIDAVQLTEPQNSFYGELKNEIGQAEDVIKSVFLHLQQIINTTNSNKKDYISATVSIIDASKQFNRVEYKLKVKLFNRQNGEISIPLTFKLQQPLKIEGQKDGILTLTNQIIQTCCLASQESTITQQAEFKKGKKNKMKDKKYKKIQKAIKRQSKLRSTKKIQRKLLSKKRSDLRQLQKIRKMFQDVEIH